MKRITSVIAILAMVMVFQSCSIYPARGFKTPDLVVRETKKKIKVKIVGHTQPYSHKAWLKFKRETHYDSETATLQLYPHFTPLSDEKGIYNSFYVVSYRTFRMKIKKADFDSIQVIQYGVKKVEL